MLAGYLPSAQIAFLDEIFKANSAILNSLLTILNERKFDNGDTRVDIPLWTVVGASNEMPESEELEALYDRFLFRKQVNPVTDPAIFQLLRLIPKKVEQDRKINLLDADLISSCLQDASRVIVPQYVLNLLRDCRVFMRDEADPPIFCSDRRLLKTVRILAMSAASNGRNTVSIFDVLLLKHIFWYNPEDQELLTEWLWNNIVPKSDISGFRFLVENLYDRITLSLKKHDEVDDNKAHVKYLHY
jgi:MoxR-like ATPase